jgi:hypothetical protein
MVLKGKLERGKPKIYLFLGGHGKPYNNPDAAIASEDKDLIAATKKIQKQTKWIAGKRKIMVVECTYLDMRKNCYDSDLNLSEEKVKKNYDDMNIFFPSIREKIISREKIQDHEWNFATILMKFAKNKGYYDFVFEKPNFDILWRYLSEIENMEEIQNQRDRLLVSQLRELIERNPDKILIVMRGSMHEKCLPLLLTEGGLAYKLFHY